MKTTIALLTSALLLSTASPSLAEKSSEFFSDYANFNDEGKAFLDKLDAKTGLVELPNGVNINLGDKFYFLNSQDARAILVDAWGNPPDGISTTAGMIFPGHLSPLGDTWGVQLHPDPIGYVDDKDAASMDYNELLSTMQEDTLASNPEREKQGYDPITLIGWAAPPKYDAQNKRLYWAKELKFGESATNTLNYDIRFLNREGVFVMSYIASMEQLPEVNASLPDMLNTVSFDAGKRYADFVPGVDKVAAVGIGGLIAGKVLAKTGLLIVALAFLKKFGVLLAVPVLWAWRKIRGGTA
jgi:uncharacterized membrane-anchored protein